MTTRNRLLTTVLALAALVASVSSTFAQSGKPPRDLANIQRKVQRSAELQRQALEALSEPARAARLVGSAYTHLKAAQDDMIINSTTARSLDPIQELNGRKLNQALTLVQQAGDALNAGSGDPDSAVAVARDRLQQALRLTNALLATGF
jgi:hypothetical protein